MDGKRDVMSRASSHAQGSTHVGDGARTRRSAPPPQEWQSDERYSGYAQEERGLGWLMFAGTMIAIVGIINFIYGIAAIDKSTFFVGNAQYIISDLNTWGWVIMFTGVIQFVAAIGIFMRSQWARWVGVATAGVNAIIQLIFIASFPLASLAIFAIDILVLYGLITYGGHEGEAI